MEGVDARKKKCWRVLGIRHNPPESLCCASDCMGWEPEIRLEEKMIALDDAIPDGWHDRGTQTGRAMQQRLVGRHVETSRGWCDALPKGVDQVYGHGS